MNDNYTNFVKSFFILWMFNFRKRPKKIKFKLRLKKTQTQKKLKFQTIKNSYLFSEQLIMVIFMGRNSFQSD